ncbi:MAG: hypothetical protein M1828_005765 [Chrysothrix sp. TS-e1954]|nr:MAG: hypothetical protein M1828_005765 [Chrysothrix sp. TS-e1954]
MRATLRLLALVITAFLIALAILSHYHTNVYAPSGTDSTTWSRPTWASLHPSNWVPSFHSGSSKAEVEEQWRLKEQMLPSEEKEDKTNGLGSAGGSGEEDMSDVEKAKALDRLKNQYGDDDVDNSKGSIDWYSIVAPTGGEVAEIEVGVDVEKENVTASTPTSKSSVSTSSSSSSTSFKTKAKGTATASTTATVPSTTLKTSTTKTSSSSQTSDEWAYLSDLGDGPSPTSTVAYEHLNSQALDNGFETHVAATGTSSTSSTPSSSHSNSGSSPSSSATKTANRKGFATMTAEPSTTSSVDLEKAAYDYLSTQATSTTKEPPHAAKPQAQDLHGFDNLRDLGIE